MKIAGAILFLGLCMIPWQTSYAESTPLDPSEFIETLETPEADSDKYIPMDYGDISRMYWAIGKMELDSDDHIDNYLRINECDMVQRYYNNEIQWHQIRDATRASLQKNMKTYPRSFDVVIPITVGKYNEQGQYFDILDPAVTRSIQRLELSSLPFENKCTKNSKVFRDYPHPIVLSLNRPFLLTKIPVEKEMAAAFIEQTRQGKQDQDISTQTERYRREAYLRVKFRFMMMKGTIKLPNHDQKAEIYTRLDGYEVYADKERLRLLYAQDYDRKVLPRRMKNEQDSALPNLVPPKE